MRPLAAAMALALCLPAACAHAQVTVSGAWARATPPQAATAAAYLSLTSATDDRLLAISSPQAAHATLHEEAMNGAVMQMRALPAGIPLPAGQSVILKPGADHIMLDGLKAPLVQGGKISLHLTFAHAAPQDVSADILAIGAAGPDQMMPGMDMGK